MIELTLGSHIRKQQNMYHFKLPNFFDVAIIYPVFYVTGSISFYMHFNEYFVKNAFVVLISNVFLIYHTFGTDFSIIENYNNMLLIN